VYEMQNEEKRKEIIKTITDNDEYYKNNDEVIDGLEEALIEVELMQQGKITMKSGRELLKEIQDEERSDRIKKSYDKAKEMNGEALFKLAKESDEK
jgi:hypothetical protein